jgi:hypothetical protein
MVKNENDINRPTPPSGWWYFATRITMILSWVIIIYLFGWVIPWSKIFSGEVLTREGIIGLIKNIPLVVTTGVGVIVSTTSYVCLKQADYCKSREEKESNN